MAFTLGAYAISANSHSAALFRLAMQGMISGSGVVGGAGDLGVVQNGTPNMTVLVSAGVVYVPGTLGSTSGVAANIDAQTAYGLPSGLTSQGAYAAYNDAQLSLTISAADPTNPRIDLIVASVQDAQYSGSNNQAVMQVITGTPAPSPSAPSAPASSVVLAQVAVAAGTSSIVTANITDKRPVFALNGGIPRLNGTGQYPGNPATGSYIDDQNVSSLLRWNGTAWVPIKYGPWTTYTPGWFGATTNPTIGNGTLTGRYCQTGKLVTAQWTLSLGSTSNAGAGVWTFGLPLATSASQAGSAVGRIFANNSGVYFTQGLLTAGANSTTCAPYLPSSTTASNLSQMVYGTPWNFKSGDSFQFTLEYEAA